MKRKTGSSLVARIIATAVAAVVVITGTPATVLADGDGSGEVTIETVKSDESAAESAVSTASTSVGTAQSADSTTDPVTASGVNNEDDTTETFNPAVTAGDVKTALGQAQSNLTAVKGNMENASEALNELESAGKDENGNPLKDESGNPIGLLPSTAADLNTAKSSVNIVQTVLQPVTDENGDPVYIIQLDENGNEVKDENGNPVYVQQTKLVALIPEVDPDGNPIMIPEKDVNGDDVYDENGNVKMVPMLKAVDYADINKNTTGSADNAISSAKTANTSNSEYEAYTAAQTAVNELEKAEEGLLDAGKAVYEATEKVNQAEKDLAAAEAAKKAAQDKYDQLKAEIKNGQKNATAANEQLKAAEKYAKGLEQEAQKKYEEYIGGKENLEMLKKIDTCSQDFDEYIANNIDKNADGTLVFKSDDKKGIKGYENDKEFWNKARDLSLALLEYSIKSGKLQAYNPENNDNPVSFEDGYKLVVGDNFKVTLTTHEDPENISDANVNYDENGNPYIELKEEVTNYELVIPEKNKNSGKWKDDKAVPGEKKVTVANGMIKVDGTDSRNRVVVTFRDSEGNEIGDLPQFYFNYKVNSDGTVYYYQRTFKKDTETVEGDDKAYLVSEGTTGFFKNGVSSDENNITKLVLKKDDVIVDKDENTKLYVHTGSKEKVKDFNDKEDKPHKAEEVKITEVGPDGKEHQKVKEEVGYSIVNLNGQEIVKVTKYKFYYTVTEELTSKNDNYESGNDLSKDDLKKTVREYLLARGVVGAVDIHTGNGNGPQKFEARYSDGTKVTFTVNVSHEGNSYSYTIGREEYKTEKTETRYIAENSKGYKIKETYTAVKSDPVYAGYSSYTNETGITWESDSVKTGQYTPLAQQRAQRNGQLELAGDGRSYTNATEKNGYFDYKKALELKHLFERYNKASVDVATASAATQQLKDDIDKLTVQYNGLKNGEDGYQGDDKDPDNDLYKELKRLDNEISKLRQNLNAANYELSIAKKELGNLETKVWEARDAVAAIDLSRFNGGGDDDNGDDAGDDSGSPSDTADTGDITVVDEIPVISYIPTADAAPSGVAGVRTGRTASRSGVAGVRVEAGDEADAAEKSAATKTVAASDTADKKAADTDDSGKNGSKKVVKIANNEVPLVETPFEEGMQFNWLWLLAVAAAVIAAIYIYDNRKRKAEAENELKKYDKK